MILLLCMQPWFSIDKCDSKPIKKGWKCHILRNFSVGLNFLDYEFKKLTFRPFLLVLNHICQSRIKVACKVAKSFLTLFPVTLVKVEVQESSLHQMNRKKVYFLPCFMQNVQKLNMVGCRALNDRSNHYGPPCKITKSSDRMRWKDWWSPPKLFTWILLSGRTIIHICFIIKNCFCYDRELHLCVNDSYKITECYKS